MLNPMNTSITETNNQIEGKFELELEIYPKEPILTDIIKNDINFT